MPFLKFISPKRIRGSSVSFSLIYILPPVILESKSSLVVSLSVNKTVQSIWLFAETLPKCPSNINGKDSWLSSYINVVANS